MCEQFKTDFAKKVCENMEANMLHKLKLHYDISVVSCAFKDATGCKERCKEVCVISSRIQQNWGFQCVSCKRYLCVNCIKYKLNPYLIACIDCYMVMPNTRISPYPLISAGCCEICNNDERFCVNDTFNLYCNKCHSFNSFVYFAPANN
jgi:hypothetical protein